jgi:aminobenzoyl-glutamate transport protein
MASMGSYLLLAFAASQFIAYFGWSNLGIVLAVRGAEGLRSLGLTGGPLLVGFILVSASINLLIASASAKWALLAPIFVPMLMLLGYSPEVAQAAYRVGDSTTNIITPLMPYFPILVTLAKKYEPNAGLGTLLSLMVPYSLVFGLFWSLLFLLWIGLGIPFGPGAPLLYIPAVP